MEKTFREVIADIKEGEIWESMSLKIYMDGDNFLNIDWTDCEGDAEGILVGFDEIFKIQRKQYIFEEAFKSYEKTPNCNDYGIIIESAVSGNKYVKRINLAGEIVDCYLDGKKWSDIEGFSLEEIRGKWYIND